ncbi:MAG: hypothetical protein K0R82_2468 [Flavipsychrobacter sp.]|jgi:hypothetical protein|nr:hypothetical protein [Flavipsychrobacter sp.]
MQTALLLFVFILFLAMVVMGQKLAQWIFRRFFAERKDTLPADVEKGFRD